MPQPPTDFDKPAVTAEEIFAEADERLRISIEENGENTTLAIEDLEFEDGNQWPDDLYKMRRIQRRPTLTINMTRRVVREICNNMRQQRPRIKVHPTGEGAQIEDAKVWAGLIRDIENHSNADYAYDVAGECAVKIGWGYARVHADWVGPDSWDQLLRILPIRNPLTVYDDPTAVLPSGCDRDWLIVSEELKRQEYKRKYPKAKNYEWAKGGPGDEGRLWESKEKIRLAEYFRIYKQADGLYLTVDGRSVYKSQLKAEDVIAKDGSGKEIERRSHRRIVQWFRLNGKEVIDSRSLPGMWIPFSRCEGNVMDVNGQVRRRGVVRDLKDVNRMLNYWETCNTEIIALAPRSRFMAAEGQLDGHPEWNDYNQKSYKALVYKPVHTNPDDPNSPILPPPELIEPMQVQAALVDAVTRAHQDLMMLAGMPHEPRADVPGAVVSGKALRERQAQSDRSHFQYYDNQTQFIEHIGEILVDLIPHYYSESRIQRIIGEDGVPQMVQLNQPTQGQSPDGAIIHEIKNNMRSGRFSIVMDTGPGYETKRQEGQEAVIDLLKTPLAEPIVKTGADLIVRNMDFAGADDLADRLLPTNPQGMQKALQQLPKEAQGIVQGLMTQLQQAQQTIQNQALEIKYGIAKAHLAAETKAHDTLVRADTTRHDTETRATTELAKAHIDSVTKRDVAEIQVGGKLIDTKVQAEHERELARETAKAAERAEKSNGSA